MGIYADVKMKKVLQLLRWLEGCDGFTITNGGKHQWVVRHADWTRPHPISFKHRVIKEGGLKSLMKKVVVTGVCTEDEFIAKL